MRTTFQKRQREMKRLEKQRMKEERRAQKRLANRAKNEASRELVLAKPDSETSVQTVAVDHLRKMD